MSDEIELPEKHDEMPKTPSRAQLLTFLRERWSDCEEQHFWADMLLLSYIGDDELTKAFKDMERWYA